MRKLLRAIAHRSVRELTRVAAGLALIGLAIMAYSIISPRPLPVILAMSVGHGIGAAALGCYVLAILLTMWRVSRSTPASAASLPPPDSLSQPPASADDGGAPPSA